MLVCNRLPDVVPAHAMMLLDFIGGIEAPKGFDTIYGNNQKHLPKPLTSMTYGDIVDAQVEWSKRFGSSAAGRYQFMRATLIDIAKAIPDLRGDLVFSRDLQNRLGYYLLLRRGYDDFVAGKTAIIEFGKALAQEWASFPVLADCKGAHRNVKRGQSYYAGDGLNKALVKPERVEAMLQSVLSAAKADPERVPVPLPKPENDNPPPAPLPLPPEKLDPEKLDKPLVKSKTVWQWIITTVLLPMIAAIQNPYVQALLILIIALFAAYAIKRRADIAKVYRNLKDDIGA